MTCLLCYENHEDYISLSSAEGQACEISSVLFTYFRFMFESEPLDGQICHKCWMKVEMFHRFYQHIQDIQTAVIKVSPIVVNVIDFAEYDESLVADNCVDKSDEITPEPTETIDDKFDTHFDVDFWQNDTDEDQPNPDLKAAVDGDKDNYEAGAANKEKEHTIPSPDSSQEYTTAKPNTKIDSNADVACKPKKIKWHTCIVNKKKCGRQFESKEAMILHCAEDHNRAQCIRCRPHLRLYVDLDKHMRDAHGVAQSVICEHCGQVFALNRTLQEHINRKHKVHEPVQCDICKEWFKSRETIRSHMNYVHIQKPITCGVCGKVSANQKALRSHLTIHSEAWKDKFKCLICGKGFRCRTKLREHSYIHSGKTDAYICQFCGKSFRFNSSISAHRMKYHPAEMAHVKERLQRKRNMEFKI